MKEIKDEELSQLIEQLMFDPNRLYTKGAPSGLHQPTGDLGNYLKQFINSSTHRKTSRGR